MIIKFDHAEFNVRDVEQMKAFFIEKLGFEVESVIEGEGVFVRSGDVSIGLFKGMPLGLKHIAMTVDDVKTTHAELVDKQVTFRFSPVTNRYTGRMVADFTDPDGNIWQITRKIQKGSAETT